MMIRILLMMTALLVFSSGAALAEGSRPTTKSTSETARSTYVPMSPPARAMFLTAAKLRARQLNERIDLAWEQLQKSAKPDEFEYLANEVFDILQQEGGDFIVALSMAMPDGDYGDPSLQQLYFEGSVKFTKLFYKLRQEMQERGMQAPSSPGMHKL